MIILKSLTLILYQVLLL